MITGGRLPSMPDPLYLSPSTDQRIWYVESGSKVSSGCSRAHPHPCMPEIPTVARTLGLISPNSSAIASVIGATVLEPSTSTVPDKPSCSDLLQSEIAKPATIAQIRKPAVTKSDGHFLCFKKFNELETYFVSVSTINEDAEALMPLIEKGTN